MEIITAMDSEGLTEALKENIKGCKVHADIIYFEGIIESLSINRNVDIIIINSRLGTEEEFISTIKNIREIDEDVEVYVFIDNESDFLRKYLISYNITKIFTEKRVNIKKLLNIINADNSLKTKKLEKEILELKEALVNFKNNKETSLKNSNLKKEKNKRKNMKYINIDEKTDKNKILEEEEKNENANEAIYEKKNSNKKEKENDSTSVIPFEKIRNKISMINFFKRVSNRNKAKNNNLNINERKVIAEESEDYFPSLYSIRKDMNNNNKVVKMDELRAQLIRKYGSIKNYKKIKERYLKQRQRKVLDIRVEESLKRVISKIEINIKNNGGTDGENDK